MLGGLLQKLCQLVAQTVKKTVGKRTCLDGVHAGRSAAEFVPACGTNSHTDSQQATCLDGVPAEGYAADFMPAYGTNSHTDSQQATCLDGVHAEGAVAEDVAAYIQMAHTGAVLPAWQVRPQGGRPWWKRQHSCLQCTDPMTQQSKHALSASLSQPFQNAQTL